MQTRRAASTGFLNQAMSLLVVVCLVAPVPAFGQAQPSPTSKPQTNVPPPAIQGPVQQPPNQAPQESFPLKWFPFQDIMNKMQAQSPAPPSQKPGGQTAGSTASTTPSTTPLNPAAGRTATSTAASSTQPQAAGITTGPNPSRPEKTKEFKADDEAKYDELQRSINKYLRFSNEKIAVFKEGQRLATEHAKQQARMQIPVAARTPFDLEGYIKKNWPTEGNAKEAFIQELPALVAAQDNLQFNRVVHGYAMDYLLNPDDRNSIYALFAELEKRTSEERGAYRGDLVWAKAPYGATYMYIAYLFATAGRRKLDSLFPGLRGGPALPERASSPRPDGPLLLTDGSTTTPATASATTAGATGGSTTHDLVPVDGEAAPGSEPKKKKRRKVGKGKRTLQVCRAVSSEFLGAIGAKAVFTKKGRSRLKRSWTRRGRRAKERYREVRGVYSDEQLENLRRRRLRFNRKVRRAREIKFEDLGHWGRFTRRVARGRVVHKLKHSLLFLLSKQKRATGPIDLADGTQLARRAEGTKFRGSSRYRKLANIGRVPLSRTLGVLVAGTGLGALYGYVYVNREKKESPMKRIELMQEFVINGATAGSHDLRRWALDELAPAANLSEEELGKDVQKYRTLWRKFVDHHKPLDAWKKHLEKSSRIYHAETANPLLQGGIEREELARAFSRRPATEGFLLHRSDLPKTVSLKSVEDNLSDVAVLLNRLKGKLDKIEQERLEAAQEKTNEAIRKSQREAKKKLEEEKKKAEDKLPELTEEEKEGLTPEEQMALRKMKAEAEQGAKSREPAQKKKQEEELPELTEEEKEGLTPEEQMALRKMKAEAEQGAKSREPAQKKKQSKKKPPAKKKK